MFEYSDKVVFKLSGLENGWIFGRTMDLYDNQWRVFRESVPLLTFVGLFHVLSLKLAGSVYRFQVQLLFGVSFVSVLHGYKIIYIVCLSSVNYVLLFLVRRDWLVWVVWVFSLSSLVLVSGTGESWPMFEFFKSFSGMENWSHHYNMLILKMISFGIDYSRVGDRDAADSLPTSEYSFGNYMCYLFYCPLFIAGPIISFNSWCAQLRVPPKSIAILAYFVRFLLIFFLMEIFSHFNYSNAIAAQKGDALTRVGSLFMALVVSVSVLFYMWLKVLLIWRFFRLWSLLAGIEAPENMNRCVLNNYSIAKFWKGWHSSFNIWIIKYIYIPLGGSKKSLTIQIFNTMIVFLFVALWHDLDWRVFHWAILVSLVFVPELLGGIIYRKYHPSKPIVIIAGSLNVFLLMACNLVGYVFGIDGLQTLIHIVTNNATIWSAIGIAIVFYSATSLMMYLEQLKADKRSK